MWLLPVYNSAAQASLDGTWYDKYLRAYVFLPSGLMHRDWHTAERDEAQYALKGAELTIRFVDRYPQSGLKPLVLTGNVHGDQINMTVTGGSERGPLMLHRAPTCEGKAAACGTGVFCTNVKGQPTQYWKIPTIDSSFKGAGTPKDFNDFWSYFGCAVHLKLRELYMPHISFPLQERLLFPDRVEANQTTDHSFKPEDLEKDVVSRSYFTQPTVRDGKVNVYVTDNYRVRNRVYTSEKEWHFEKPQAVWRLVMTERRALPETGPDGNLPWFQLKHCSKPALQELQTNKVDTAQGEDFEAFVIQFYCALKEKRKDWYMPRVRLPLPYTERTTEGESRGVYRSKDRLENWTIAVVDGGEAPLTYGAQGNSGKAHMASRQGGTSNTWIFKRVGGKWYLVELDIGNY